MNLAIITRNSNPWVFFLLSQLKDTDVNILVINEKSKNTKAPWASFKFMKRRGLLAFLDLALLDIVAKIAACKRRMRKGEASAQSSSSEELDNNLPFNFRFALDEMTREGREKNPSAKWIDVISVNSEETVERIKSANADFIVLCGAPLVNRKLFDQVGVLINAHCGIAPFYKGSSPVHWAILNKDFDKIGFTIHVVTNVVDGGPIIFQETHKPRQGWTLTDLDWHLVHSMYRKLGELIAQGQLASLVKNATVQPKGYRSYPPIGFLRSRGAAKKLRCYLSQQSTERST